MTTVSVVVGEVQPLLREIAAEGVPTVTTRAVVAREMAVDYLSQVMTAALRYDALRALELGTCEWDYKSPSERALALEQVQAKPLSTDAGLALRWLQSAERHGELDPVAELAALAQWRSPSQLPMLALWGTASVLAQAVMLADAAPQLAVAFFVEEPKLTETLNAQTSRVRALLVDALVRADLHGVAPAKASVVRGAESWGSEAHAFSPQGSPDEADHDARASGEIQDALQEPELLRLREHARRIAASTPEGGVTPEALDRARSAVERFLYQLLQRSPRTRDVFELNASLPFRFGPRRLEADFAAHSLRLVLEIDGYFHFTDADAYRRDRRKDLLLQQRGFLIARFLASDVLERTTTVMGSIEQLVRSRKLHVDRQED